MSFKERVYKIVSQIPKGRVITYAEVARRAGSPRAARAVGNLMNINPFPKNKVSCHRVICSDGTVGGYATGTKNKIALLKKEGVRIENGKVITS